KRGSTETLCACRLACTLVNVNFSPCRDLAADMFTSAPPPLTSGDVHHRLWQSRPSRGVVARRRGGGAGCGPRRRGQRKPRPRAASGSPPGAQRLPAAVRLAVNAKAVMPRGAPNGETHRYSASDPQATGHPGAIREDLRVIQVTRRFGAPFPSLGGRKT